jgi:hypothetical protein
VESWSFTDCSTSVADGWAFVLAPAAAGGGEQDGK